MAILSRHGRGSSGCSFQQTLLILLGAVLLAFMTALIGLYLALGESKDPGHEQMERVVQRLRHAHSATLDAMERAGRAVKSAVTRPPRLSSSKSAATSQSLREAISRSSLEAVPVSEPKSAPASNPFVPAAVSQKLDVLAGGRAGIVILAHDRTDTLSRCLDSLFKQPDLDLFGLAVSLDHSPSFQKMEAVVRRSSSKYPINIWRKPDDPKQKVPVAKIAAHFRFALTQSFEVSKYEFSIFIENDLILAPDFLWYFRVASPLLERDPSLWCISSWNDNGFSDIATDERRLFRTDYFPGLGWMIGRETWSMLAPLWPSFPSTGWDHWIRHGVPQLRHRDCVAPEVPRSKHVDSKGTNVKAGSGIYKLLEKMAFSKLPHGELHDVSYLSRDTYEPHMQKLLQDAELTTRVATPTKQYYKMPYVREEFPMLAKKLHLYPGQPRGARRGVILSRHPKSKALLALVDRRQGEGGLPESELWSLDPGHVFRSGKPNQSCREICQEVALNCVERQLEFANRCEVLKEHFKCENGCGHQVGKELPCYVHDRERDTALQCLMTDEEKLSCDAHHPATSRLCVCVNGTEAVHQ